MVSDYKLSEFKLNHKDGSIPQVVTITECHRHSASAITPIPTERQGLPTLPHCGVYVLLHIYDVLHGLRHPAPVFNS